MKQKHGADTHDGLGRAPSDSQVSSEVPNLLRAPRGQGQSASVRERETELTVALEHALDAQLVTQAILDGRNRQQASIVRLGLEALATSDLQSTLDLLVREAGTTLMTDFCCVLELADDRTTFQWRASSGWPVGSEGAAALSVVGDSQAHYTVHAAGPVMSPDLRTELRFTVPPLVLQQGALSAISVILHGKQQPWGVLAVHTKTLRTFTEDDGNFLQAVANLMALALERERVETALRNRNRQQAAVAMLGRRALAGPHMDDLFGDTAREVATTLDVEFSEVLQRNPDGGSLVLRAGVGWASGLVGATHISVGSKSRARFTLNSDCPVIVTDLRTETRFEVEQLLHEHGVVSGMSVLIPTRSGPFGVLGVHSRSPRIFTQDDSNFMHAVANLLAAAIERHRVEGELRRHRDDLEGLVAERTALLEASNRELESFSYTISHDLRAPLRSINGLSKIMQRKHGEAMSQEATGMLAQIANETIRMSKLIESILSLSRLGSVTLTHVPVDVSAAATSALEILQASDPERKVHWTVEPGLHVLGDEGLVRMVVENLVGNSWKFTAHAKEARITVGREVGGFRVEDNGAGFDPANARELFQPFHRLHTAEEFEGTGIGLATVSRIVGRHGGRVWAQGEPDKGATFRVTFPQDAPPANGDARRGYASANRVHAPTN